MYLHCSFGRGENAAIVMRRDTENRLWHTCFRGNDVSLAGNFSKWQNAEELFTDPLVQEDFIAEMRESSAEVRDTSVTFSTTILYPEVVGWASTDVMSKYQQRDLESFEPNRKSCALRVRLGEYSIRAPRTHAITIVFSMHYEEANGWIAVIHSIYPGSDVGELQGDITVREGVVFFDWSHPGL